MSADGSITLVWGDGENKFRYAIGQFRELQEKINGRRMAIGAPLVGPMTMLKLLQANDAWPDDIRDVLRIGLTGAGMSVADAHRKLVAYFDRRPPLESMLTAHTVLLAGLAGVPDDEIVAKKKRKKTVKADTTNPSASPSSTGPVLQ